LNYSFSIGSAIGIVIFSLFSAFLSGGIILGIGLSSPETSQKNYTFISFIIGQSFMLIPLVLFLISKKEPLFKRLRLNLVSKNIIFLSFLFSFGVIILSDEIDRIIQIFFPTPEYIIDLNNLLQPESILGFFLLFIAVAIIAPLGEELLFRGFLQQFLEIYWKDITRAILLTSLFFSFIHLNPFWFIQIYILGILLGFLSWKTNSVIPSLILHSLNNTIALILSFIDLEKDNFYLWNEHVSPWIIILAIIFVYIGFKEINKIKQFS